MVVVASDGYGRLMVAVAGEKMLDAIYGVERGRLREGGLRGSAWWRELGHIRDENKSASVAEMYSLGWGAGGEA
ncbi:hypothetical protein A2U01_0006075, partial [Trifolium medium]|nr:hypothetical protein [Trifolium medium]